jgi:hypothetical protein
LFFQKLSFDTFILFLELSSLSIAIKKFYEMKKREKKKTQHISLPPSKATAVPSPPLWRQQGHGSLGSESDP